MAFTLPDLPYDKTALKPFLSEEAFDYHHGKHHNAYVQKLNANAEGTDYESMSLEDVVLKSYEEKRPAVFNNAAQHWNHSFFWKCMSPNGGGAPKGKLGEKIAESFESFEKFKETFAAQAAGLFGSGWTWLSMHEDGKLEILPLPNAETPLVHDQKPILTIDVWEHAYYIDYRNARPKFVEGFWDVVDWDFAEKQIG